MPKTADLLEEIAVLKAMLIAADARDKRKDERIARLEKLVAAFKQAVFGRKSEKSNPDQFELALEGECQVFCVWVNGSMLLERSQDDDDFQ
ncbi:transposase, partial [Sedimentimonas flavescens]